MFRSRRIRDQLAIDRVDASGREVMVRGRLGFAGGKIEKESFCLLGKADEATGQFN